MTGSFRNRTMKVTRYYRQLRKAVLVCVFFGSIYLFVRNFNMTNKRTPLTVHSYQKLRHLGPHLNRVEEQTCIQPQLPVWDPSVNFTETCAPIVCSDDENWVYTHNGKFYIDQKAVGKHGEIVCAIQPVINDADKAGYLPRIFPAWNGSLLQSDAFKVICSGNDKKRYVNIHAGVSTTVNQLKSKNRTTTPNNNEKFNVLIIGFDSMSRQAVQRSLPKSRSFFEDSLNGILLEGFNILGDGTTQNLMPMLTGSAETEIPEVRREKSNVRYVDEAAEFIWKRYERQGYVTSWAEDMSNIGTFHYRMIGFKQQPVHHYLRPYFLEAEKYERLFQRHCMGSLPQHKVFLNWIREGLDTNADLPFFTFGFFSKYSHNDNSCMDKADDDLAEFLEYLSKHKTINKTIIFFMSDHGLRTGVSRQTEQGKLEERMPYFAVFMPKDFMDKYPAKYTSLLANSRRLVTHFDIYETFRDILGDMENRKVNGSKKKTPRAYSLFTPVPATRTCADAGIEPHWCACLLWDHVSTNTSQVRTIAAFIVSRFNSYLSDVTRLCHTLALHRIIKAVKFRTNKQLLHFKQSKDADGRMPDFTDQMKQSKEFYQVTIETSPGGGFFEVTSSVSRRTGQVAFSDKDVSRLNLYNDSPKCVAEKYPSLRPYCICF